MNNNNNKILLKICVILVIDRGVKTDQPGTFGLVPKRAGPSWPIFRRAIIMLAQPVRCCQRANPHLFFFYLNKNGLNLYNPQAGPVQPSLK